MSEMHENAGLYNVVRQYKYPSGPYECLWKHWWIKSDKYRVFQPRSKCELKVLNCGEEVFGKIEHDIRASTKTVDIITWGFDPGMVLTRTETAENGTRYGSLLKEISTRPEPVLVRILVWHDDVLSYMKMANIPGFYGGRFPTIGVAAGYLSEEHEKYNVQWFNDIMSGAYPNIRFHVREVPLKYRSSSLAGEKYELGLDGWIGSNYPTHHQKMVLIDYEVPHRAVGYVMGHNSITDFWDTVEHKFNDPRRETLYKENPKGMYSNADAILDEIGYHLHGRYFMGERSASGRRQRRLTEFVMDNAIKAKPYQDVSVRVRGPILYDLNFNFCEGWSESEYIRSGVRRAASFVKFAINTMPAPRMLMNSGPNTRNVDKNLEKAVYKDPDPNFIDRRKRIDASEFSLSWGVHSAQLLRTQPMHNEKGIKECYANLTRQLERYIFIQNQYIQYEEWADYLKECVARLRKDGYTRKINVFILTSTPESNGMDLPTYGVARKLGQSGTMVYEHDEAKKAAEQRKAPMPITPEQLSKSGINVVMGSMWTCSDKPKTADDFEEIYIHAKVAIVDDAAFTIGSANLNVRSMALDSELNVLSQAADVALDLRKRLFLQLTGNEGPAAFADMSETLRHWQKIAEKNLVLIEVCEKLTSQLVMFHVNRKPAKPVM